MKIYLMGLALCLLVGPTFSDEEPKNSIGVSIVKPAVDTPENPNEEQKKEPSGGIITFQNIPAGYSPKIDYIPLELLKRVEKE